MLRTLERHLYYQLAEILVWTPGMIVSAHWNHTDSRSPVYYYYWIAQTVNCRTTRETPFALQRSFPPHRSTTCQKSNQHTSGFPLYWNSEPTILSMQADRMHRITCGAGMAENILSMIFRYSILINIIICPLNTRSGLHFSSTALLSMKCKSKVLASWAIAIICLTQCLGSQSYASRSPTRSSQNTCLRFPHRSQSRSLSQRPRTASRIFVCRRGSKHAP